MLRKYRNGSYWVIVNPEDGTKIQYDPNDQWTPEFPESIDISISDKCIHQCLYCYMGCTSTGRVGNLHLLSSLGFRPYTEVSINLNDPIPGGITDMLYQLVDQEVFPNVTIRSDQFVRDYSVLRRWVDEKLVYGIGVSLVKPDEHLNLLLKTMPNAVVHVIAGVVSPEDLELIRGHKLLVLGYKHTGRGPEYFDQNVEKKISWLRNELPSIIDNYPVVCFDNVAVEDLNVKSILSPQSWKKFYMGDEGSSTFAINLVKETYALSSHHSKEYPMGSLTIDEMFRNLHGREKKDVLYSPLE